MKLLIAEDDATSRSILTAVTGKWGYEPVAVEDGEAAWEIMQGEDPPRLLLLDWEMPKMDGLALCQKIRQQETRDPPFIVLLTARSETSDTIVGLDAGANDYISKPFENAELQARLRVGQRMLDLQSERMRSEEQLQLAANVFSYVREGIIISDSKGTIIDVNDAFVRITGYERDEVIGKNSNVLSSGRQGSEFFEAMWDALSKKGYWNGEIWNRRKGGELFAEMMTISAIRDEKGVTHNYVALFSDITEQKEQHQRLEYLAHNDALTKLPNRSLFSDRLSQAMNQVQRREKTLAVVYLDLDGFKAINDTHGHDVGDQLLVAVSARMKQALREGDTIARLGGDEFAIVLLDLMDSNEHILILDRLLAAAAEPVHIENLTLHISASIGVTVYPQTEDVDMKQLIRQADLAMYKAKSDGKNRYHIFNCIEDTIA